MDFADLTEEHYSDPILMEDLHEFALLRVNVHLTQLASIRIDVGLLLNKDYDGIFYVWDNYNIDERFEIADLMDAWDEGVKALGDAMVDMMGDDSKLQWWHSYKSWVSSLSTLCLTNAHRRCPSLAVRGVMY